jgi:hypothetical protein
MPPLTFAGMSATHTRTLPSMPPLTFPDAPRRATARTERRWRR